MSEMVEVSIPMKEAIQQIRDLVTFNFEIPETVRKNILYVCDHAVEHRLAADRRCRECGFINGYHHEKCSNYVPESPAAKA